MGDLLVKLSKAALDEDSHQLLVRLILTQFYKSTLFRSKKKNAYTGS